MSLTAEVTSTPAAISTKGWAPTPPKKNLYREIRDAFGPYGENWRRRNLVDDVGRFCLLGAAYFVAVEPITAETVSTKAVYKWADDNLPELKKAIGRQQLTGEGTHMSIYDFNDRSATSFTDVVIALDYAADLLDAKDYVAPDNIYSAALDLIGQNGERWGRVNAFNPETGCYCLAGALFKASTGITPEGRHTTKVEEFCRNLPELKQLLPGFESAWMYNDTRRWYDVQSLLAKAIALREINRKAEKRADNPYRKTLAILGPNGERWLKHTNYEYDEEKGDCYCLTGAVYKAANPDADLSVGKVSTLAYDFVGKTDWAGVFSTQTPELLEAIEYRLGRKVTQAADFNDGRPWYEVKAVLEYAAAIYDLNNS